MLNLVRTLKAVGVRVSVLPRLLEVVGSSVEFDDLHGVTVMGVRRLRSDPFLGCVQARRSTCSARRWGCCAVSPLLIVVAIAIKLDSRGPVFFRQLRVGRHGKRFQMLKFRTMVPEAEAMKDWLRHRNEALRRPLQDRRGPPRHTGRAIAAQAARSTSCRSCSTSLRGEMSLVGPTAAGVEEDLRVEGWHRRRLELMPGMTGPWQILGPARVPLREMVAIDYLYVANWSPWTDIKIMLRTVPHVVGRRGL